MTMAAPANRARADLRRALRDAGFAALLAFGLFLPLIGFKTVQDIHNELLLQPRFGLLAIFVGVVTAGSFLNTLVIAPWRHRQALRPRSAAVARRGASRRSRWALFSSIPRSRCRSPARKAR